MKNINLHVCSPWSGDCAMEGVRLNIHVYRWFIHLALTPGGRVAHADGSSSWLMVTRWRGE